MLMFVSCLLVAVLTDFKNPSSCVDWFQQSDVPDLTEFVMTPYRPRLVPR